MRINKIIPIKAFHDNYIWCIQNGKFAVVVDPGDAEPVLQYLSNNRLELVGIMITHHHADHVGGLGRLLEKSQVKVFGPTNQKIPEITDRVNEGDKVIFPEIEEAFTTLEIPGHTIDHIGFYNENTLFCGDTLFSCGCGRIFEGTPKQMYASIAKLANLSDQTLVFCTHEYTQANIKFALAVEPDNEDLLRRQIEVEDLRESNLPSLPTVMAEEKKMNPFLRAHKATLADAVNSHFEANITEPEKVFKALREWKDSF